MAYIYRVHCNSELAIDSVAIANKQLHFWTVNNFNYDTHIIPGDRLKTGLS